MVRATKRLTALYATVTIVLASAPGEARVCGGEIRCQCGDTVSAAATLTDDLGPCRGSALRLVGSAVLDCTGHAIVGSGVVPSASHGVQLEQVSGAQVRNCRVEGFGRGIRLRGGRDATVVDNELVANTYGIEVAGGTSAGIAENHRIEDNVVRASALDGIHLGYGTHGALVTGNTIENSGQENLYLLYNEHSVIRHNTIRGGGAAAIYVKHSEDNHFIANSVSDRPIQIRGRSWGNVFAGNEIVGAAFAFEAHEDGFPHDNLVLGGAVTERYFCFRFAGAFDNRVAGVLIGHCTPAVMEQRDGQDATGNVVDYVLVTADFDGDGLANAEDPCTDTDGDGFADAGFGAAECARDNCRAVFNPDQDDPDADGSGTACDVCPLVFDPAQLDRDADGVGDACSKPCEERDDGAPCDDGDTCTRGDACAGGVCVGGTPRDCDDGNSCTHDSCDAEHGCVNAPNEVPCDDGDPCTRDDICVDAECRGFPPLTCPAPDACHDAGACDPATGACVYARRPDGTRCDDGNACTRTDTCVQGVCTGGSPLACGDADLCTLDTCEPAAGCRHESMHFPALADLFAEPLRAGACDGERVPRKVERLFRRAASLIARAETATPASKASRRLRKAVTTLARANRATGNADAAQLSGACMAVLSERTRDAYVRTVCLSTASGRRDAAPGQ